ITIGYKNNVWIVLLDRDPSTIRNLISLEEFREPMQRPVFSFGRTRPDPIRCSRQKFSWLTLTDCQSVNISVQHVLTEWRQMHPRVSTITATIYAIDFDANPNRIGIARIKDNVGNFRCASKTALSSHNRHMFPAFPIVQ